MTNAVAFCVIIRDELLTCEPAFSVVVTVRRLANRKSASATLHIVSTVRANVKPGRIVLSHDCKHPDTVAAYAILVPWLKQRYQLIALPT